MRRQKRSRSTGRGPIPTTFNTSSQTSSQGYQSQRNSTRCSLASGSRTYRPIGLTHSGPWCVRRSGPMDVCSGSTASWILRLRPTITGRWIIRASLVGVSTTVGSFGSSRCSMNPQIWSSVCLDSASLAGRDPAAGSSTTAACLPSIKQPSGGWSRRTALMLCQNSTCTRRWRWLAGGATNHSARRATIGSMRDARRAGR
jgi:hypothetical protein